MSCAEAHTSSAQTVKNLPAVQETWVQSLVQEDPLEKEMATHYSILAWTVGGPQSMGSQRVRHYWVTNPFTFFHTSQPSLYIWGFISHSGWVWNVILLYFFLSFWKIYLCMYLWLCWVFIAVWRPFSRYGERGLLWVVVRGLLVVVTSLVAEHGL